jgi:hypothetical protein
MRKWPDPGDMFEVEKQREDLRWPPARTCHVPVRRNRGTTSRTASLHLTFPQVTTTLSAVKEPLPATDAKRLILEVLENGNVSFSRHALDEMAADNMTTQDILNVLRAGIVDPGELERGSWRYRVRTPKGLFAVVAFRSEVELRVVTAWKSK